MLSIDNRSIGHFWQLDEISEVRPFGTGHINDTYLVTSEQRQFILQRVNKKVFNIPKLVSNYELLCRSVTKYEKQEGLKITPVIFKSRNGAHHYIDDENFAWRLAEYIPGARSYDISPTPEVSYEAAKAIGSYQLFLNTLDPDQPCETIRSFHNLAGRITDFEKTIERGYPSRLKSSSEEIAYLKSLAFIQTESAETLKALNARVIHNDTKLNNVLFTEKGQLVIDLDTVMKGYVMYDFGDMVRSYTSPVAEDEKNSSRVVLRMDHFEALTQGYLEMLRNELSADEKGSLYTGICYIIYEQAIRFLTDYLNGDLYYKTDYPEHNLVRTRTQINLLNEVINRRAEMEKIIKKYS